MSRGFSSTALVNVSVKTFCGISVLFLVSSAPLGHVKVTDSLKSALGKGH